MRSGERLFLFIFGLFLALIGLYVLAASPAAVAWRILGGLALLTIGGNAMWCAWRRTRSWLSRIGPLP